MAKRLACLASICLMLTAATAVRAAELTVYPDADTYVMDNDTTPHGSDVYMYLQDTADATPYIRFDLAKLNVASVQAATFTVYVSGGASRNDTLVVGRFALAGLNNVAGNTAQNWSEATLTSATAGAEWSANGGDPLVNVTDLDGATNTNVTETLTNGPGGGWDAGTKVVVTGPALVDFIQGRVKDNGLVTFLVTFPNSTSGRGFGFGSKENTTVALHPTLVITATTGPKTGAVNPSPANGATEVLRDAVLSWKPGVFAVKRNVYFGTDPAAVTSGAAGVLVSEKQDANTYDPTGNLAFDTTYYWRVDEVNGAPDYTITNGEVWSFTTEKYSYPVTGVTAEADGFTTGSGPENTVNSSGLDATGLLHSTLDKAMWISGNTALPHWIKYTFTKPCKLDRMWVWNYNAALESTFGMGAKDVKIEYSLDGSDWTVLTESTVFAQAASAESYEHNTEVVFGGVAARYVKLTILNTRGLSPLMQTTGLSEVRFFYIPVAATAPAPTSATTNVDPRTAVLSWRAGREAVSHELYLATDVNAVTDGTVAPIIVDKAAYVPPSLQLASTYYWKVVEVNQAAAPSAWASDVWSLSTLPYITIDTFESYTNDVTNRVFQTWIDGMGYTEPAPGKSGNNTGSLVGYDPQVRDVMETSIVHGGSKSMPLAYDNSAAPKISEADRTFEQAQDWSKYGITTLVLWFRGDVNNISAPLYVKINGGKPVYYNNGASCTASAVWKQWNVDLAQFGAGLEAVKTLTLGVGNGSAGGTGTLFIDDILLYMTPPAAALPVDPGVNGLAALYAMENNVDDSSGNKLNGTLNGGPSFVNSKAGFGNALAFDGTDDYVDLPIGPLISSMSSTSISAWVYFTNTGGNWQRIFDFGNPGVGTGNPNNYMFLTCNNNNARTVRFAMRMTTSTAEQGVNAPAPALPTGWHHVAIVIDGTAMTLRLYQDGLPVASGVTNVLARDLGATTQNWLGRSQWTNDAYLNASLDDLRIFNRALSEGEVRYLAGDR